MSVISTAKRRRRQAANGYRHLAKLGRPVYAKKSASKQAARLARLVQRERERAMRKGMKKK